MNVSIQYPEPLHAVNCQLQSIKMQRGLWDGFSREGWALCLELRWRAWAAALRGVIAAPPSSLFDTPPKTHLFLPPSRSLSFFVSISFSAALSFPFLSDLLSVGEMFVRFLSRHHDEVFLALLDSLLRLLMCWPALISEISYWAFITAQCTIIKIKPAMHTQTNTHTYKTDLQPF